MNFRRIFKIERNITIIGSISISSSGLYAFIFAGAVRLVTEMEEKFCFIWIGIPVFIILLIIHIIVLPPHLRRAGLID